MNDKCYTLLIVCHETVPLNQNGLVHGIIFFEKGYCCDDVMLKMQAHRGVRIIEIKNNSRYILVEKKIAKKYLVNVGNLDVSDVIKINFTLSLSKFNDPECQFNILRDRQSGCLDVIHELLSISMTLKAHSKERSMSADLSIYRQYTLFDRINYSLATAIQYSKNQYYMYAQCELISVIQKIKTLNLTNLTTLILNLKKCRDIVTEQSNLFIENAQHIIKNFPEYEKN